MPITNVASAEGAEMATPLSLPGKWDFSIVVKIPVVYNILCTNIIPFVDGILLLEYGDGFPIDSKLPFSAFTVL